MHAGGDDEVLEGPDVVAGRITVAPARFLVLVDGRPVTRLSVAEFRLLRTLAERAGHVVPAAEAGAAAWPRAGVVRPRAVRAIVTKLRAKLGPDAAGLLRTVPGIGLVLDLEPVVRPRRL